MAVVIVTGASSGIGEATARYLVHAGHTVVMAARRTDRLAALHKELAEYGEVDYQTLDVSVQGAVEALVAHTIHRFGCVDVLVNNAGVSLPRPWWAATQEAIGEAIAVNLTAAILGARAVIPHMAENRRGHIINIASVAGHIGVSGLYSATKFGLRGHTESLRRELRPLGIAVSLVTPGFIATEMTQGLRFPMAPPTAVARVIGRLIRRPRREIVVPGWYRALIALAKTSPRLVDRLTARHFT